MSSVNVVPHHMVPVVDFGAQAMLKMILLVHQQVEWQAVGAFALLFFRAHSFIFLHQFQPHDIEQNIGCIANVYH